VSTPDSRGNPNGAGRGELIGQADLFASPPSDIGKIDGSGYEAKDCAALPEPVISALAITVFKYDAVSPDIANALRQQAARIREQVRSTTTAIIGIGRDLIAAKQHLAHGQFCQWVADECGFNIRTAANYMRAAIFAEDKMETVSILPPATLYKLASKSAPPEVVKEVISRAEAGTVTPDCEVKAMLDEAGFARRQVEHKNRKALRRSEFKRKRERRGAEGRERQDKIRKEEEAAKSQAQDILSHIGVECARFLVDAMKGHDHLEILRHLQSELDCADIAHGQLTEAVGPER
jgi:hypothetical protein